MPAPTELEQAQAQLAAADLAIQRLHDQLLDAEDRLAKADEQRAWDINRIARLRDALTKQYDARDLARRWSARWKRVACALWHWTCDSPQELRVYAESLERHKCAGHERRAQPAASGAGQEGT
jgi:hypothetical protein